jgi:hypothetical protein
MQSCLYEGTVWHRRSGPVAHRFRYKLSMLLLDLDEVDALFAGGSLWPFGIRGAISFRRSDHLGDPRVPLTTAVRQLLASHGLGHVRGPIRLLTQPRCFGLAMNPAAFYFCYGPSGEQVEALIVQVTNTPWGEQHCYLFPGETALGRGTPRGGQAAKALHVSPFLPMDVVYCCRASAPGERLSVAIENQRGSQRLFRAGLRLARRPWTAANLRRSLLAYPLMTQRVALGIYWQALRLWWKGCPIYAHPARAAAGLQPRTVKAT